MTRLKRFIDRQKKVMVFLFVAITLVPFIFTSMWSAGIHNISFGVYDGDQSAFSRSMVQMLDNTQDLNVCYYAKTPAELEKAVKYKTVDAGIIIPEDFSADMGKKLCPTVILIANGSDVMLGGTALGAAGKVVGTLNAGVQLKTLEGSGMMPQAAATSLASFSYVERLMYEQTGGFVPKMMYTIPLIATMVLYTEEFFMPTMIEDRRKWITCSKEKQKSEVLDSVLSVLFMSVWIILAGFVALVAMHLTCGLPMRGNLALYFLSMFAVVMNMNAFALICFTVVRKEKYYALFIQFFCTLTSTHMLMSGLTFPFHMMPKWVQLFSKIFYPLTPLAYELKALNLKGIGLEQAMPYLLDSLRYTVMWLVISVWILKKDVRKNRERESVITEQT